MIIVAALIGAVSGAAASKGTSKVREFLNDGESIERKCPDCAFKGPHPFVTIDRSWATGATIGLLTGGVGGVVSGAIAKKIFYCERCNGEFYETGEKPTWNADKALEAFVNYPELKEAYDKLESLLARNQHIARKHQNEIIELERKLRITNSDKRRLTQQVQNLVAILERELGAA